VKRLNDRVKHLEASLAAERERAAALEGKVAAASSGGAVEPKVAELEAELGRERSARQEAEALYEGACEELDQVSSLIDTTAEEKEALAQQLKEMAKSNAWYLSERVQAESNARSSAAEVAQQQQVIQSLREQVVQLEQAVATKDDAIKQMQDMAQALRSQVTAEKEAASKQAEQLRELESEASSTARALEDKAAVVAKGEAYAKELASKLKEAEKAAQKAEEAVASAKRKVAWFERRMGGAGAVAAAEAGAEFVISSGIHINKDVAEVLWNDLERYKGMQRCSVCKQRRRKVMLQRCGHTFCDKCIEKTLAARNRKCPSCHVAFSKPDVLPFYLQGADA